jgi:predicted DNA-binding transcriptional regulator AlpA
MKSLARTNIKGEELSLSDRFMRANEVVQICSLSRPGIYKLMANFKFPPSFHVSEARVGWLESDVLEWMRLGCQGFYETYGEKLKQRHNEKLAA